MKAKELRELSDLELQKLLQDTEEEIFRLRIQKATGQLENVRLLKQVRKRLARIKTILREREILKEKEKQEVKQ